MLVGYKDELQNRMDHKIWNEAGGCNKLKAILHAMVFMEKASQDTEEI